MSTMLRESRVVTMSTPLCIGMVTETYPPEINGVANTVFRFSEGLRAKGHRLQLIRPRQSGSERDEEEHAMLVTGVPLPGYRGLRLGLPAGGRLTRLWRSQRPDIVYVATEGPLGWSAIRTAHRLGIPVISGFHTNFHAYSCHYGVSLLRGPIYRYLRDLHNRTTCTVVPTTALQQELSGSHFRTVEVVGRGVDLTLFSPLRRQAALRQSWGVRDHELVALYVGRLAPEKNLPLVIRAWQAMRARHPGVRLVLVGDGPLYKSLFHSHPDVVLAGEQRGEALAQHYASADLFLFASETETYGNVVLEAMASGLPAVAFDYAAPAMLIESGRSGQLVAPGDDAAFVVACERLVEQPARIAAMGVEARRCAADFDWPAVVDRFESLLFQYSQAR